MLLPLTALLLAGAVSPDAAGLDLAPAPAATEAAPVTAARPVYRLRPALDASVMGVSALAITVPTLLASDLIHPRCPCDPSEINGFDRGAVGNRSAFADAASDVTAVAAILAPPLLDFLEVGAGEAFYTDTVVFAEVLLVNGALVEIAKYAVQRPLPRTYAGDPSLISEPGGYRSFYSGHTSTVFAALTASAMTARLRHGERWWPWAIAGIVGSSVAVERVAGGRHFPTDVLVGALAGTATGVLVPWLHAERSVVTIVPVTRGVGVALRF
ncbi:MAG: phosphatase PAP2 family protein [Anaeromyxobacteraceae bacterium]